MPRFTVDTHLFAELGALLVGRDSTALNELVKNAYDADASKVIIHGEGLATADGSIHVIDDGIGMTADAFERGFLRIASRVKRDGEGRSAIFNRHYTGRKGIGRLAAHKLATQVIVQSTPDPKVFGLGHQSIQASIDWGVIESLESLDDTDKGIELKEISQSFGQHGTTIELRSLRKSWSESMLATFVGEVQSFEPPIFLVEKIPGAIVASPLLFEQPVVRDSSLQDPGFSVQLTGDFDIGEEYWLQLAERSQWVIEIQAKRGNPLVEYAVGPTLSETIRTPLARAGYWKYPHPDPISGPFFSARIFVRATRRIPGPLQGFARGAAGIRLFMEGFRVLPYGERGDDWLRIDADYTRRREPFELGGFNAQPLEEPVAKETFFRLANSSYYGGVFLTDSESPMLNMLINREGFIPDPGFDHIKDLVRRGVDLSVRLRASVQSESETSVLAPPLMVGSAEKRPDVAQTLEKATATLEAMKARTETTPIAYEDLRPSFNQVADAIRVAQSALSDTRSERQNLRVAASVGSQLSAFVHEMNILLGQARSVNTIADRFAKVDAIPTAARRTMSELRRAIGALVYQLERQASFLTDVVGANARRRRQRLRIQEQVEIALKLLSSRIERNNQTINIDVGLGLQTPPMFSAEFLSIMINVLTNAVKAAGDGGIVLVNGMYAEESLVLEISNTGVAVDLSESERWFRPFESTTTEIDEVLGQGMGLGLPIVRRLLDEYGGSANFTQPSPPFATMLQMRIPERSR